MAPIVFAFVCGYTLPELVATIDSGFGVRDFADARPWIIVPATGLLALVGGWRAFRAAGREPAPH